MGCRERGRRGRLRALVAAVGVALTAAACGGGAETTTSTDAGGSGTPTGAPVKIMIIAPTETAGTNVPEAVAAAEAAVRGVNSRGGVKGHHLDLVYCNEKNVAATAKECAQRAVDEKVLAVVSVFNGSGGIMPILEEAGIPAIGSTGIAADGSELTSKISFMLSPLTFYPAACPSLLKKAGAKKIGLVGYDLSVSDRLIDFSKFGAKAAEIPLDPIVRVPLTTSDFLPTVTQLTRAGVDGTVLVVFGQAAHAVITGGGSDLLYCHSTGVLGEDFLEKQGPVADNLVVATPFPELSQAGEFPELQRMIDELAAEEAAGNTDAARAKAVSVSTTNAWLSVQVVEKVGNAVDDELTSSTLLEQLSATSDLDLGIIPPLDFTKPVPLPGVERVFNSTLRGARWDSATKTFVSLGPETYPALDLLRAGAS